MAHYKLLPSSKFSRKYPDDPRTEVVEAAKSGDAELLNEVLEELNSAERISALSEILAVRDYQFGRELKTTPLIIVVENGNLDCVKVLLKYKADTEGRGYFSPFRPHSVSGLFLALWHTSVCCCCLWKS